MPSRHPRQRRRLTTAATFAAGLVATLASPLSGWTEAPTLAQTLFMVLTALSSVWLALQTLDQEAAHPLKKNLVDD
jgi:hypothetical protein